MKQEDVREKSDNAAVHAADGEELSGTVQLQTLLQHIDGGVCIFEVGREIRLVYASAGLYQMLGLKPEELPLPCLIKELGIHPDYEVSYEQMLRKAVQQPEGIRQVQRILHRQRGWIWRQARAERLLSSDSESPLMLELSTDVSEFMEMERELRESNERLRAAFGQTPHILWEVDLESRTFDIYNVNKMAYDAEKRMENYPEALLENGIVHPDSAEDFRRFAMEILNGNSAGSGNFIIRDTENGCYEWAYLSYHMSYDESGKPSRAIGVQDKLPGISGMNPITFARRALPEVLRHHILARFQVNLTADSLEYLWIDGADRTARTWGKPYSDILERGRDRLFVRGGENGFYRLFRRRNLLKMYDEGKRWFSVEYRRVSADGTIRWMEGLANLQYGGKEKSIYMFGCFVDCQKRKEWELLLPEEYSRERKNRLYKLPAMTELCGLLLQQKDNSVCAMACIEIFGTDSLKGNGDPPGEIFTALTYCLGPDCIACQYRENTILVFFPGVHSKFGVKRRIEDAFGYVRMAMYDMPGLDAVRFISGTTVEETDGADMENMCMKCNYLCAVWKNAAMDTVVFPNEDEWDWLNIGVKSRDARLEEEHTEPVLSKATKDAVLECVSAMLMSDSLEVSVRNALRCLGEYYQANRTYILALSNDRREVTMINEWVKTGKNSIRQIMSGVPIQKVPLLSRCMKEGKALFMKSTANTLSRHNGQESCWRFSAVPLKHENRITGFLCVENSREHTVESALIYALIPYLFNEYRRFRHGSGTREEHAGNILNRIPNLRAYTDVVYSMNSDVYTSMGAVALDIPNYSALNGQYGFEYGRELLEYIAETLNRLFGKGFVFRTWDAEFAVLIPNTILEVFNGRSNRLRTMIQRRYPHQVRIGYTWSDGIFSAGKLVREAKAIMRCEEVREAAPGKSGLLEQSWPYEKSAVSSKSFLLYLQPKMDMRDGSLMGAEALVRGIDENGKVIPPAQFIERLEENGGIRDLDYFMLESVLYQLSQWKRQGMEGVNISVNISRHTLFSPTVLASVLAIFSHYPEIDPRQIKLEITETAGDMETAIMTEIVESFREFDIGFELDDFGSRYANVSVFSNIKFNTIKLDRSLIKDLPGNEISRILVKNIAEICRTFGMKCVAEGVETQIQKEILLEAGCVYGQGYYFDRPMPAWKFEEKYLKDMI